MENLYIYKALDNYYYDLEKTVEALNYALSYEPENIIGLCLMADIQLYRMENPSVAVEYYEEALRVDPTHPKTYLGYAIALKSNAEYERAIQVIEYAITLPRAYTADLYLVLGQLYETTEEFNKAIKVLKEALFKGKNNQFISFVKSEIKRVKTKIKTLEKRYKKEQKAEEARVIKEKEELKTTRPNFFARLNSLL